MAAKPEKLGLGRRGKRSYHHGNLREAITAAALEIISEEGPAALSLREAARRAGVSQAAPYRHFDSKEALVAAVAEEGFRRMGAVMERALIGAGPDPVERLQELGVAYVRFAAENASYYRVMFGPQIPVRKNYPGLSAASAATFQLLVDGMAAIEKAGVAAKGTPLDHALAAWSLVHGLSSLIVDGQLAFTGTGTPAGPGRFTPQTEKLARAVTRQLSDGLRRR